MATLVLMEPGTRVSIGGGNVRLHRRGVLFRELPRQDIGRVLIFGAVELCPTFVAAAFRHAWDVTFLNRRGRFMGRLESGASRDARLRVRQIISLQSEAASLEVARPFILGKLHNQRAVLQRAQRRAPSDALGRALIQLRHARDQVPTATTRETLRGLEGSGSAAYFEVFGCLVRRPEFVFRGRNRRPPRDPINACLSFGYGMLASTVTSLVLRVGLDPLVGALHAVAHGTPALVLDLMEEWRPVLVDTPVLRLINRSQVNLGDFQESPSGDATCNIPRPSGVLLGPTGRRIVIREFLTRLRERTFSRSQGRRESYENILLHQVRSLARVLSGGEDRYTPFLMR